MKNIPEELALVWQQMLSGEVYDALHPRLVEMLAQGCPDRDRGHCCEVKVILCIKST